METRHLFFSIRMIWNHLAPVRLQLEPFKRYRIYMTREYILSRTKSMLEELSTRSDVEDQWLEQLQFMQENAGAFHEEAEVPKIS